MYRIITIKKYKGKDNLSTELGEVHYANSLNEIAPFSYHTWEYIIKSGSWFKVEQLLTNDDYEIF